MSRRVISKVEDFKPHEADFIRKEAAKKNCPLVHKAKPVRLAFQKAFTGLATHDHVVLNLLRKGHRRRTSRPQLRRDESLVA